MSPVAPTPRPVTTSRTAASQPPARAESHNEAVFVARQPILDSQKAVYGYELLFRSGAENAYTAVDGRLASFQTINRAVHSIGLPTLVGDKKAFINFTHDLLLDEMYMLLPPERCVVELPPAEAVGDDVVAACRKLKAAGFKLALDNVIARRQVERLLPHCDFIKVDLQAVEPAKRGHLIREFAGHEQKLIAGKVETAEDFALAVSLGCRYVQGYFFCRPEVLKGKGLAGIEQVYLQLLGELKQPQLDFARVESLIKRDVSLSYKLLRYMDTAAVAVGRRVTSVQDALAVLGEQPLRKWLALVCFTSLSRKKPSELLLTCLVRGNFCEAIAKATHLADRQLEAFFIGLLSGIEAVLDMPLDALVKQMTLPDEVRAVLLGQPGANEDLVRVYTLAQACERGAWGTVIQASARLRLTQSEVALIYYDALGWANQALHEEKK